MYKYELHAHTAECDRMAFLNAKTLVQLYHEAGYDGMVITDHYINFFYDIWFPEELQGLTHHQQVWRWLKGYRAAREEGEKIGFTVLPGAEVRFNNYPNDYLIYGLHEEFFYTVPRLNELHDLQELFSILPENVCVVQAHPFRNGSVLNNDPGLFGMEVFNGGTEPFRNQMALQFAEHYGLAMTSGSDVHNLNRLALGGICTERRIQTPEDLVSVLRSNDYSRIEPK